jgi:phosphonatase-like hydrolase
MGIELVVFDMAGTTVNDEDSVNGCLRAALQIVGLAVTAVEVNAVMGLPKPDAIAILVKQSGMLDQLRDQIQAIHQDFVDRSIAFYQHDPSVHEVAGASRVFRTLSKAGVRVALNTGFNRSIAQVIIDRLGWSQGRLIDAVICSDEVPRGRPHPDMIQALMNQFGITDPQRVAKVGDTPADLLEGTNADCGLIVGVTHGTHTRQELEPYPHSCLIETIAGFPELLGLGTAEGGRPP